jgi:hypothetical protein
MGDALLDGPDINERVFEPFASDGAIGRGFGRTKGGEKRDD